jgi:hypothetical protein
MHRRENRGQATTYEPAAVAAATFGGLPVRSARSLRPSQRSRSASTLSSARPGQITLCSGCPVKSRRLPPRFLPRFLPRLLRGRLVYAGRQAHRKTRRDLPARVTAGDAFRAIDRAR